MKRTPIARIIAALAVSGTLAALSAPAQAVDLKDLGIDLGTILGRSGKGDSLGLVESILEREMPRHVGPAKRYEVRLGRTGNDLARGKLSSVDISGFDVRTQDGLVIPEMDMHLEGVKLGLSARKLESVSKSLFSASLGEAAVSRYVSKRAGARLRDVKVAFRNNEIQVSGTPELLGFGMKSEVRGAPVLSGGDAVDFRASRVSVLGLKLPRFAVDTLEERINPVVDLSGLKLPVKITELRVRGNRLVADGSLSFGRR